MWLWSVTSETEFATPKKSKNLATKQLKTESLAEIGSGLDLLLKYDRLIWELRSSWQTEFEAGLCGEGGCWINQDRATRQDYLDQVCEINLKLQRGLDELQVAINKLKKLKLKK
jgi:hypothetical protein